ncbi:TPA: P-loop ATPase, Sll1717 family [Aeromonas veronii]
MKDINTINLDFYDDVFGNDAGEDESPERLSSYFIDKPQFRAFFNSKNRFGIVRARKGMGKSAMLSKFGWDKGQEDKKSIVIFVTGSDLLSFGKFEDTDHLKLQNEWKKALSARINLELANHIGFAWKDEQLALVEAAELSGYKGRNLVGSLISRIKTKHIPIEIKTASAPHSDALLERYMHENNEISVYLLIDDIDSTFSTDEIQKARVSSFFSACRAITRDIQGVVIRASVRSDVWTTIRYNEDLDKCEQYITDITWTTTELEKIISNKILSFIKRNHTDYDISWTVDKNRKDIIELVFNKRISWGKTKVSPYMPLRILGAKRPRWMTQLCRLSSRAAYDRDMKRVSIQDVNYIMKDFGRLRVNDIYKEHSHQFIHLQKLIEAFSGGGSSYTTNDLLDKIKNSFTQKFLNVIDVGNVDGVPFKSEIQLAHLLFKIGFIHNRTIPALNSPPVFVDYQERPELLSDPSEDYSILEWEIHPSYRSILSINERIKIIE